MSGLFAGTSLERPVTCEVCERPLEDCGCPRNAEGQVTRPCDQKAVVRIEKRRGRPVTVVAGLDPVATDCRAIAGKLRTTCGAGGSVTDVGIEVQGDHREAVGAILEELGFKVRVAR